MYCISFSCQDEIERKGCIVVDYKELVVDEAVTQAVSSLRQDLRDMPEHMIKCLGLAQHQVGVRQRVVSRLPMTLCAYRC